MNRRIALAAVLALALAPHSFAGAWHKTVAAAQKVAKEKNQLILVDMFAEWCGWCHRFEREVFPSAVFQDATRDMVLLRLDTEDKKEGTQMAMKYGITSLPTFLVLTPDLIMAGSIRGYAPPNQFVAQLKDARTKQTTFEQRVKNEARLGKDYIARLQLAQAFSERGEIEKSEPRFRKLTIEKGVPAVVRDEAYFELSRIYLAQKKLNEAVKELKTLTSLSKHGDTVELAHVTMSTIYLQQGNLLAARNTLRFFRDTYPASGYLPNVELMLSEVEKRLSAGKR